VAILSGGETIQSVFDETGNQAVGEERVCEKSKKLALHVSNKIERTSRWGRHHERCHAGAWPFRGLQVSVRP